MTPEALETFAIRAALGNNGGVWAEHYTESQKEHWRDFIIDLCADIAREEREACAKIAEQLAKDAAREAMPDGEYIAEDIATAIRARK